MATVRALKIPKRAAMATARVLRTRKRVAMATVRVLRIPKHAATATVRVLNIPKRVAMVTARDLVGRRDRVEKSILVILDRVMAIRIAARTCRGMVRADRIIKARRRRTWVIAVARRCLRWRVVRVAMIAVAPARVVKAARVFIAAREIVTVALPCSARRVLKVASSPRGVDIAVRRVVTARVVRK